MSRSRANSNMRLRLYSRPKKVLLPLLVHLLQPVYQSVEDACDSDVPMFAVVPVGLDHGTCQMRVRSDPRQTASLNTSPAGSDGRACLDSWKNDVNNS